MKKGTMKKFDSGLHKRLVLMATDFAHLYSQFTSQYPDPTDVSLDDFQALFDCSQLEYLHYAGGTTLTDPFHSHVVEDALQLSATYLALPKELVRPHVRTFGLLVALFMFSTQPRMEIGKVGPMKHAKEQGRDGNFTEANGEREEEASHLLEEPSSESAWPLLSTSSSPPPTPVRISLGSIESLLTCVRGTPQTSSSNGTQQQQQQGDGLDGSLKFFAGASSPLSKVELTALLMMHKHGGWNIQPFDDTSAYMGALLCAHDTVNAPLLRASPAGTKGGGGGGGVKTAAAAMPPPQWGVWGAKQKVASGTNRTYDTDTVGARGLLDDPQFKAKFASYENLMRQLGSTDNT